MREGPARIALVTGASRGIGAAIADRLAGDGLVVYGTATSADGANAIAERLGAIQSDSGGVRLDVNDRDSVAGCLETIGERHGPPTVLVNNAGITRDQILLRMKDEDWEAVLDTDLRSVFRLVRACLRGMMKARWGRVVSISSVIGSVGNPGQANYAAAKAGVEGFGRALAREIGSRGITANVVAPGFVDTDMTRALDDGQRERLLQDIPLQRLGAPADIAGAVAWLVSKDAAWVTGQTIHVNGGMYMT